jgi:hypothetical protein
VQPPRHRLGPPQGGRLAGEQQESGLKDVVGVVLIVEDAPAQPQDHRPVAADQGGKGGLVVMGGEALQQLAVRHLGVARGSQDPSEVAQDGGCGSVGHGQGPPKNIRLPLYSGWGRRKPLN